MAGLLGKGPGDGQNVGDGPMILENSQFNKQISLIGLFDSDSKTAVIALPSEVNR